LRSAKSRESLKEEATIESVELEETKDLSLPDSNKQSTELPNNEK